MAGELQVQTGIGEWTEATVQLLENGLVVLDREGGKQEIFFRPETRVVIPMRNLRREPQYKGCAFQIESASDMKTFMAPALGDKNAWARKLNIVLADLKTSGRYAFVAADENSAPVTPVAGGKQHALKAALLPNSTEKQLQQRAAVQQLAQSLQSKRTAARVPETPLASTGDTIATPTTAPARTLAFGGHPMMPSMDRSREIDSLQRCIEEREQALQEKETQLTDALQRLQREQQYREQITAGVEKWRADVTKQGNQKLQDTRERLEEEQKRVDVLEKESKTRQAALTASDSKVEALEAQVRLLEEQVESSRGLKREIAELRARLDKEVAFVQVLEHDTRQMAEELLLVGSQYQELKEHYHKDTHALREQCGELKSQLEAKDEEAMALKEEVGRLRIENKRLLDGQHKMHREFFFSLALSIKLSLAQQGCYSNCDLNSLYEQILSVEYARWPQWLEQSLRVSEVQPEPAPVEQPAASTVPNTPLGAPVNRKQPERSAKKKTGGIFGGLFN